MKQGVSKMRIDKYELDNFFDVCAFASFSLPFVFINPVFFIITVMNLILGLKKVNNHNGT